MTGTYEYVFECGFECAMELKYSVSKGHRATRESPAEPTELEIEDVRCARIEGPYSRLQNTRLFMAVEEVFDAYFAANEDGILDMIASHIACENDSEDDRAYDEWKDEGGRL